MPNIAQFGASMNHWAIQVKAAGATSVSVALDAGAAHMRQFIAEGSPTGTPWHDLKNALNGYPDGSRMGNQVPGPTGNWTIHPDAGNMFRSVQAEDAKVTKNGINGRFGWIHNHQTYFGQQDAGTYMVGNKRGMGLINSGRNVGQKLGSAIAAEEALRTAARQNGFSLSGSGTWKDK